MQNEESSADRRFNAKLIKVLGVALIAALFILGGDVFLLLFAGILFAVLLRSLSNALSRITSLPKGVSLGAVVIGLLGLGVASSFLIAPSVGTQIDELSAALPKAIDKVESYLTRVDMADNLEPKALSKEAFSSGGQVLSKAGGLISGTLGWLANGLIIFFLGLYLAAESPTYERGTVKLVPIQKRKRASQVIGEVHHTLQWWLIGKIFAMLVIGVLTTLGLWLLDVPLALTLGIIAAVFTFVPNIGPIASAIPAVLLGLVDSPDKALYVALLYVGIQTVESYLLTPLVQRKTISLPPALTLIAQILLGVLFGILGVALATPLIAAVVVITRMLYIEDALGDHDANPTVSSLPKAS